MKKMALITGASRGLGKTIAGFLAAQGYDLILTARDAAALAATVAELQRYGGQIVALPGDVSDGAHQQQVADAVAQRGRLDLLINNASILGPSPQPMLAAYPIETLEQVFAVNTLAPLALVQTLLPWLTAAPGLVVNLSSDAAVGGYAGWGGYGASKAALDLLSLTLANELRNSGIAVVSVDPGDMRTQMHQEAFPGQDISDRPLPEATLPFWAWLLAQNPLIVSGRRFQAQAEVWTIKPQAQKEQV
ncbi:MAG: SDR family NAD(P)-dependent oxidoreductase [Caldilinea sp. CFX5]|nr:SDR family NAD(P)-dependent oxidoreductase [Caldilinea sp. CFX5]